ncbi:HAD-IIIC family phosphatase [Actinoplanes sp. LDG1-06]|uniref:HAD-IIIC family phosphatase n=1 Tax=Paractinoplanes ovalisporus TaxID=2810368 RepID=A0ABS2AKJ3_9ACTN|nr:HAD-IIIC family phosphatase [Actinoplanes ovalisporus]MBM2620368.1 HAD-IIIC family phosphatase [Actinoplanes ovalisporus]
MTPPVPADLVKCVVWDLDDTVWDGVLAEGGAATLRHGVADLIRTLDARGILQSVASKNEPANALERLRQFGLDEYFLYPQVSWSPKSELVRAVADQLNINVDTLMFVDDSPFERAEVADVHPQIRCVDSADLAGLAERPELNPPATADARNRRVLYRRDEQRRRHEESFEGPRTEFLRSLGMSLTIAPATPADLDRAAELTQRTHQLNTTGLTFAAEDLRELLGAPDQTLLTMSLTDRFGSYGTIGVALLGLHPGEWRIRLLLMSCRVMGRNIGGAVLTHLMHTADAAGLALTADFLPNDVNRPMYMVYRLAGFSESGSASGPVRRLTLSGTAARDFPDYVDVDCRPYRIIPHLSPS